MPIQFLRVLLGLLAMFFGYMLGRAATRLRQAGQPWTKAITWILRTVVSLGAIIWTRGFDWLGILLMCLTFACLALGIYLESRPRHQEEIHLFTEQQ